MRRCSGFTALMDGARKATVIERERSHRTGDQNVTVTLNLPDDPEQWELDLLLPLVRELLAEEVRNNGAPDEE